MTARQVDYGFLCAMLLAGPFFLFVVIRRKETQSTAVHVGNRRGQQQHPDAAAMPKDGGDSFHRFPAHFPCEKQTTDSCYRPKCPQRVKDGPVSLPRGSDSSPLPFRRQGLNVPYSIPVSHSSETGWCQQSRRLDHAVLFQKPRGDTSRRYWSRALAFDRASGICPPLYVSTGDETTPHLDEQSRVKRSRAQTSRPLPASAGTPFATTFAW